MPPENTSPTNSPLTEVSPTKSNKRILCDACQRAEKACICPFIVRVENTTHVVVLQHPSEVKQVKGTVALLAKSLTSCEVIVGESFDNELDFKKVLSDYQTVLLYPSEHAKTLGTSFSLFEPIAAQSAEQSTKPLCLVILDGTWKKAYRMFMLSKKLQEMPQVSLPENIANSGQYHIRKVAKKNALSSLEATCYALALIENDNNGKKISSDKIGHYQPLLNKFHDFNQFQLSFRPDHINTSRKIDAV